MKPDNINGGATLFLAQNDAESRIADRLEAVAERAAVGAVDEAARTAANEVAGRIEAALEPLVRILPELLNIVGRLAAAVESVAERVAVSASAPNGKKPPRAKP